MKNKLKYVVAVLLASILTSCGSMRVYINHDSTYSRKNPITIINPSSDATGTQGELQYLLQSNGYKLISPMVATKSLNYDSQSEYDSYHGEVTKTTTYKTVYVLEYDYSYYYDLSWYSYTTFSATITDLRTGEIIMTANFRGDKSVRSVLNSLVNKMNQVIK